jgi:hypothetical protein
VVASFLQTLSYKEPYDFEAILRIFMGVLIEDIHDLLVSEISDK